ncbi:MAG: methylhydantoinase [Deltaproteobacteria bacterium]|nr:methylhydantoinase [Deltaproteobacteria bacterium]
MVKLRLGVDIGGTFTDFALIDDATGKLSVNKCLTTPGDPSEAIMKGLKALLEKEGLEPSQIDVIVQGTTLATNALIERKGAKTGLITTEGFRDVLELRREVRYDIFDLFIEMPEPVVPRDLRLGVRERVDKDGNIITQLDESHLIQVVDQLLAQGVESVAVCFLNSYANAQHEKRSGEIMAQHAPSLSASLSSEVAAALREDERFSTAAINAYVRPLTERYLNNLSTRMASVGFKGALFIMLSNGGLTTFENAKKFPVRLIESGPAGGTMAAVFYSNLLDTKNLVAFDMGGTTAKISMVQEGKPAIAPMFEAARLRRFMKGSGLPVMISAIDLMEIGAGGGSIGWVDNLGLLRVGPESSGADPGPACYGLGGEDPTVTDAALILGYLDPDYFLGGEMKLDKERAERAVKERLADRLGLDVIDAAWGIHRVITENMASAARIHVLEKGKDPRRFSLLAFGGAGPIHAWQTAKLVGSPRIISPLAAGVMSALGFLVTPVSNDFVQTYISRLEDVDWDRANGLLEEMEKRGREQVMAGGVAPHEITVTRTADMRYVRQGREINVPIPNVKLSNESIETIRQSFYSVYQELYSRCLTNVPIEIVSWKVLTSGPGPKIELRKVESGDHGKSALKGKRQVYFPEYKGFVDCPIYDRYRMGPGMELDGPAVVEERESTLVVGPGGRLRIDGHLNAVVEFSR